MKRYKSAPGKEVIFTGKLIEQQKHTANLSSQHPPTHTHRFYDLVINNNACDVTHTQLEYNL